MIRLARAAAHAALVVNLIGALLLGLTSVASATPFELEKPAPAPSLDGIDGEMVVDYAPAGDPAAPEVRASVTAMHSSLATVAPGGDTIAADEGESTEVAITFNAAYPSPGNVQDVVRTAASDWATALDVTAPVEIEVLWFPFGNQSVLGAAGPLKIYQGGGLPVGELTPGPLANVLLDTDIDPDDPEIQVVLNRDFGSRWYVGTSGNPVGNQVDLYTVVLHELGHGFGFVGSAADQDGAIALSNPPYGYDTHVFHGDDRLLDTPDPNALLRSDNLFFDLPDGDRFKLHAPATWQQGSSYSHFDEATYTGDDPGTLMTPRLDNREVHRTLDPPVVGVMGMIGWPLVEAPPPMPPESATIGGTVTSTSGDAVAGLVVDLFVAVGETRGTWLGDATTSSAGEYRFLDVEAGCYILTFIAPDGAEFPTSQSRWLNTTTCVEAGEVNDAVNALVRVPTGEEGTVGGTVTSIDGSPVGGLVVDLFTADVDGSREAWLGDATTDTGGEFRFEGVQPACYVLTFIAPEGFDMVGGNRWLESPVCLPPNETVSVDAQVTPVAP